MQEWYFTSYLKQDCGSGSSSWIWIQFRIQEFDDSLKLFFYIYWIENFRIYLFLGLHKGRTSYMRSLQPSKDNIQHFKT
jgi:hypothetical protein